MAKPEGFDMSTADDDENCIDEAVRDMVRLTGFKLLDVGELMVSM